MNKCLLAASISLLSICVHAQGVDTEADSNKRIWTQEFKSVDINAPIKVILKHISDNDAPCVIYDTNGCESAIFTAEVDKKGVLRLREQGGRKPTVITEVEVRYHNLEDIRIARADVLFADTLSTAIADIEITDGAHIRATIDMTDLKLRISNKCVVELSGDIRYLTTEVSSSTLDATALACMSCRIAASHKSEVDIDISERLEAEVSYGAKIRYFGTPSIIRRNISIFGGEITGITTNTKGISSDISHE